ncbi:MAG: MBL fold metallo-hydrolase [bacterium]|nr:MBL fold metallo-hydrolase [bacterium]
MKRFLLFAGLAPLVLAVAGGVFWSWATAREAVPETSDYTIDVDTLRRLARSLPGPPPLRLESELVAKSALPRAALFAGESFEPHTMVHQAFRLVYPSDAIVIDPGFSADFLATMGSEHPYNEEGWVRIVAAVAAARSVWITHEHGDHLEGVARYPKPAELVDRLVLTREQLENTARLDEVDFPDALRDALDPLDYEGTHAVAPGLVLLKARGHTPGSQMFYVRLADDREFLLLGDVAWHLDQIRELHYRPRLVTNYFINEERALVLAQFRSLHELLQREPGLVLVPSHDAELRTALVESHAISERFSE